MVRELFQLNTLHKKIIVTLIGACCSLVVLYGVLVRQTVAHVVARKVIEQSIVEMGTATALREADYMTAMDALTLSRARELGFVETSVALFVSRQTDSYSLRSTSQ